jgi:hypothetical protein
MFTIERDHSSKRNRFAQITLIEKSVWLRVTLVENGWPGKPSVRLQIKKGRRLYQGPEIPVAELGLAAGAALALVLDKLESEKKAGKPKEG